MTADIIKFYKLIEHFDNPWSEIEDTNNSSYDTTDKFYFNDTVAIPAYNFPWLQKKIEEINEKSLKIGLQPIEIEKDDQKIGNDNILFYNVRISGEVSKFKGWKFVGAIEPTDDNMGVIIKPFVGIEIPEQYNNIKTAGWCDHCKIKKFREVSYILVNNDGKYQRIGRSCLKEFLEGNDPKKYLTLALIISNIINDAKQKENIENKKNDHDSIDVFLAYTVAVVKRHGFSFDNEPTTAQRVLDARFSDSGIKPSEKDYIIASDAIEFVKNKLESKSMLKSFENDMLECLKNNVIDLKDHVKSVVLIIGYYLKRKRQENSPVIAEIPNKESEFVGAPGERIHFKKIKLMNVQLEETDFGTKYFNVMVDSNNNVIIWVGVTNAEEAGMEFDKEYQFKGRVKSHKIYKNKNGKFIKTTCINIVKNISETFDMKSVFNRVINSY